ncbi:MAG: universal stress protein [Actinocatenispora sp.]
MTVSSERHRDPEAGRRAGRVLVGVDGSPAGRAALTAAGRDAGRDGLQIVAVHVRQGLSPLEALGSAFAPDGGSLLRDCRDDGELSAWLDCVQVLDPSAVRWQFQVRTGNLVEQLRAAADSLSVRSVYLATRSRPWWARHLHHCPAHALARGSGPPVHVSTYTEIAEYRFD